MEHDELEVLGNVFQAGEGGFLAKVACGGEDHGGDEGEGIDRALLVLLHAVFGAHDDDLAHIGHGIEGFGGPGEDGPSGDLDHLLAALATETLARTARKDDGSGLGLRVDLALEADGDLRDRRHAGGLHVHYRILKRTGRVNRVDRLRSGLGILSLIHQLSLTREIIRGCVAGRNAHSFILSQLKAPFPPATNISAYARQRRIPHHRRCPGMTPGHRECIFSNRPA